jgi:hypothetical protein
LGTGTSQHWDVATADTDTDSDTCQAADDLDQRGILGLDASQPSQRGDSHSGAYAQLQPGNNGEDKGREDRLWDLNSMRFGWGANDKAVSIDPRSIMRW